MYKTNEDSDMKIAGGRPDRQADSFDAMKLIEETKNQRFNGNLAKAKTLGENIVSSFSYKAAPDEIKALAENLGIRLTPEILLQIKILSVFSAEYCLDRFLPSAMLSTAAINELYGVLQDISPEFYMQLSSSLAFSFYYLTVRKNGGGAKQVGSQFAMLCGAKGDAALEALGTKLHEINVNVYKKAIGGFAFV